MTTQGIPFFADVWTESVIRTEGEIMRAFDLADMKDGQVCLSCIS